jgi:hypothetical protein
MSPDQYQLSWGLRAIPALFRWEKRLVTTLADRTRGGDYLH